MKNKKPKILIYDIETSPNIAYVWGKWEQNVIDFQKEWEILSFAYKFVGDSSIICKTRADFKCVDDKKLVEELHRVMSTADITIAHNGDSFDNKKAAARFIFHDLPPLKRIPSIDTKKVAKRYFNFNSNSLNDLGQYLKLGKKLSTGGFPLWLKCMAGDKKAWRTMAKYNKQDVVLLEKLYMKFLPWISNHPNLSLLQGATRNTGCANCGSSNIIKKGLAATHASLKQRIVCLDCGAWGQIPYKK
jgi:RNase P subunit RPR2